MGRTKTKKEIIKEWDSVIDKFPSNYKGAIDQAISRAENQPKGSFVDILGNGTITKPHTGGRIYCDDHEQEILCPKCTILFSIEGWNIMDDETLCYENREGTKREGYLWWDAMGKWLDIAYVRKDLQEQMYEEHTEKTICLAINRTIEDITRRLKKEVETE